MKNLALKIEFFFIVSWFVLIPFFLQLFYGENISNTLDARFSIETLICLAFSIVIYIQFKVNGTLNHKSTCSPLSFLIAFGKGLSLFGWLVIFNIVLTLCDVLIQNEGSGIVKEVLFPETLAGGILFVISVIVAACFEEILFRLFIPEALKKMAGERLSWLWEIISVALFATGHIYLGWTGFINSILAGITLRFFFKKTGNIWINCTVHSIYNLLLFAIFFIFSTVQPLTS